jgi:hypothetical protein
MSDPTIVVSDATAQKAAGSPQKCFWPLLFLGMGSRIQVRPKIHLRLLQDPQCGLNQFRLLFLIACQGGPGAAEIRLPIAAEPVMPQKRGVFASRHQQKKYPFF